MGEKKKSEGILSKILLVLFLSVVIWALSSVFTAWTQGSPISEASMLEHLFDKTTIPCF